MSFLINSYRFGTGLLLDTYPAAAAYGLRKLRTAYTGSAIRVRRASDNTEQDIGFSGNDLDTTAISTFCSGTSGFIRTWYDQSGNGLNLEQTTAGDQPRIFSGGSVDSKNGKPAIYFNDKLLTRSALSFLAHSNNASWITVSSHETANGNGVIFSTTSTAVPRLAWVNDRRSFKFAMYIENTSFTGFSADLSAQRDTSDYRILFGAVTSSKGMSVFDNGQTGTTNTYTDTYTNEQFRVGRQFNDLTGIVGHIPEIILFDSNQSSNRSGIESGVNSYYGVF